MTFDRRTPDDSLEHDARALFDGTAPELAAPARARLLAFARTVPDRARTRQQRRLRFGLALTASALAAAAATSLVCLPPSPQLVTARKPSIALPRPLLAQPATPDLDAEPDAAELAWVADRGDELAASAAESELAFDDEG